MGFEVIPLYWFVTSYHQCCLAPLHVGNEHIRNMLAACKTPILIKVLPS
jgi:hypothetical protein